MHMKKEGRKSILDVIEDILKLLSDKNEYSTQNISILVRTQWRTTIKALEFMKRVGLVKERKGDVTYKAERLWSLK